MDDYSNFPPCPYFKIVLNTAPHSAALYMQLWNYQKNKEEVIYQKKDIRKIFLISPTMFRNLVIPIVSQGLADIEETLTSYILTLTKYD